MVFIIRKLFFHLIVKGKEEKGKDSHHDLGDPDTTVQTLYTFIHISVKPFNQLNIRRHTIQKASKGSIDFKRRQENRANDHNQHDSLV